MKRLAVLVAVGGLLVGGCSDDSSDTGNEEVDAAIDEAGGDFCSLMENFNALSDTLGTDSESGEMPEEDVAAVEAMMAEAVSAAPDELSEDLELMARASEAMMKMMEVTGGDILIDESELTDEQQAQMDELNEEYADLEDADVEGATARVNAYVLEECGVDLEGDSSDTAPASETTTTEG